MYSPGNAGEYIYIYIYICITTSVKNHRKGDVGGQRETGLIKHTGFLDNMGFVNALERSLYLCTKKKQKKSYSAPYPPQPQICQP
jgi:hypothetical protein